jgi:hypothetical protein
MYGDCVSCGFPILVKDTNQVLCPFCATLNQPVSGTSYFPLVLIAAIVGVLVLSKVGK